MKTYKLTFTAIAEVYIEADSIREAEEIAATDNLDFDWDSIELETIEED